MSRRPARTEHPGEPGGGTTAADRVLTLPNLISFVRLLGVPALPLPVPGRRRRTSRRSWCSPSAAPPTGWTASIARRLGQVSRLGELLDPLADRLYILATLLAFTVRGVVPWWFTIALLAREACMLLVLAGGAAPARLRPAAGALRRQDRHLPAAGRLPGAAARLGDHVGDGARPTGRSAGALAWWGLVLYWVAGGLYVVQAAGCVARPAGWPREPARERAATREPPARFAPGLPHRAVPATRSTRATPTRRPAAGGAGGRRRAAAPRRVRAGGRGGPGRGRVSCSRCLPAAVAAEPEPQPGPRRVWSTQVKAAGRPATDELQRGPTAAARRSPGSGTRR